MYLSYVVLHCDLTRLVSAYISNTLSSFPTQVFYENLVTLQVTERRAAGTKSWLTSRPTPAAVAPLPHGTYYSLRYEKRASERARERRYLLVTVDGRTDGAQNRVIVEFLSRSHRHFGAAK